MGPPSSSWESWWAFWLPRNTTAAASSYSIPLPPTLLFLKDSPGLSQMKGSNSENVFSCLGSHSGRCLDGTVPILYTCLSSHRRGRAIFMALLSTFFVARTSLQRCERWKISSSSSLLSLLSLLTAAVRGALWSPPIPLLKRPYLGCLSAVGKLKASSSAATGCPDHTWWYSCLLPHSFFPGYLEPTLLMYYLLFSIRTGIFHIYFP